MGENKRNLDAFLVSSDSVPDVEQHIRYDEIPELTDDFFANAIRSLGGIPVKSDLTKPGAAVLFGDNLENIPTITGEEFAKAAAHSARNVPMPGRPPVAVPKQAVSIRLDADVLAHYRASGPGWQGRINLALRRAAKLSVKKRGGPAIKKRAAT